MISGALLETIFDAASMQRWNDYPRPVELTELDKQAHKMVIAWVLARLEEDHGHVIDWNRLIETGIFEFFRRTKLTDIKPPVLYRLMATHGERLNLWVYDQLREADFEAVASGTFAARCLAYYRSTETTRERRLLDAAHYMATRWEFNFVYRAWRDAVGIDKVRKEIEDKLEEFHDLESMGEYIFSSRLRRFTDLCGQMRFQQRWAQTMRVPRTSVLGHTLSVAIINYLFALETGACPRRAYNAFFGALFHDLPEALTRDIISPVKRAVEGLDDVIKGLEAELMQSDVLPLLPAAWHDDMRYYTENEFALRTRVNGVITIVNDLRPFDRDEFDPAHGALAKAADELAAYYEAALSIQQGISNKHLTSAKDRIAKKYAGLSIDGFAVGELFNVP